MERIQEAETSKLVLTPIQKEERISAKYVEAAEEVFHRERRLIYKRRLEEMAYVLYKMAREEEAMICFAGALSLREEEGIPSSRHPFLLELIKRTISSVLWEEEQESREVPSFIVKP